MRHGFLQEVRSLARGNLPGLEGCWLAQVDYAYEGRNDIERSCFTLVLTEAAKSSEFAVRVLCHDRRLSKRDRSNPDSDREVVELDDETVKLESEALLERYAISTDHDQDQLSVWQLFDPSLIQWLTAEAPDGFSFELQDGALSCFVPGNHRRRGEARCALRRRRPRFRPGTQHRRPRWRRGGAAGGKPRGARRAGAGRAPVRDPAEEHQGRRQGVSPRPRCWATGPGRLAPRPSSAPTPPRSAFSGFPRAPSAPATSTPSSPASSSMRRGAGSPGGERRLPGLQRRRFLRGHGVERPGRRPRLAAAGNGPGPEHSPRRLPRSGARCRSAPTAAR